MIRMVYLGILFIMIVMVFAATALIRDRKDEVSKSIYRLFLVVLFSIISNSVYVMSEVEVVAVISHSLFLASIDWLLLFMLRYTIVYTESVRQMKRAMKGLYVVAALDSANLLMNLFFGHIFVLEERRAEHVAVYYSTVSYGTSFYVHLIFSYLLVIWILSLLIYKIAKTAKMYRKKYGIVLLSLILIVVFDAIGLSLKPPVDISLMFYCLGCFAIFYFSIYYVPRSMNDSILTTAVTMADMGVACFDVSGKCIYINYKGRQMVQRLDRFRVEGDYQEMEKYFAQWLQEHWREGDEEQTHTKKISDGYRQFVYEFTVQRLTDEMDNLLGYFVNSMDRTEEFERFEEEHYRATHDMLTGLYNEHHFHEKVLETLNRHSDVPYVMITSDINDFKLVNDLFGTERGDEVLKMFGQMFRKYAKEDDVYGRLVEDHFAFCMPKERFDKNDFIEAMKEIENEFTNDFFRLQIKMGVYEITDIQEPIFVMIDKCNLAIAKIKGVFTERVAVFDDELFLEEINKNRIINEFDTALSSGEIHMYLQAQTTAEGKVYGAEALARWKRPQEGMVSPVEFIPILEQAGLIWRLDMYIWEQAAKRLAEWRDKGREDLYISVNISAQDQYHVDIFEVLTGLVEKYNIKPESLKLEITETIFITEVEHHLELVKKLQVYGFRIAIDDFGSGYSSLNILKDISADELKIDMEFLRGLKDMHRNQRIVECIVELAKKLDMFVVVEGVETEKQLEVLKPMGCDAYQGFYFARPIPIQEFEELFL